MGSKDGGGTGQVIMGEVVGILSDKKKKKKWNDVSWGLCHHNTTKDRVSGEYEKDLETNFPRSFDMGFPLLDRDPSFLPVMSNP